MFQNHPGICPWLSYNYEKGPFYQAQPRRTYTAPGYPTSEEERFLTVYVIIHAFRFSPFQLTQRFQRCMPSQVGILEPSGVPKKDLPDSS